MKIDGIKKALNQRIQEIDNVWESWRSQYVDLRDYILPGHGLMLEDDNGSKMNDGGKRHSKIIDDTATASAQVLAAGMQSGLTSPARPWFKLGPANPQMIDSRDVKIWLSEVEDILQFIFAKSNVYNALHHTYLELAVFNTGAMSVEEDFETVIHCRPYTVGEYRLATDSRNQVDTVYRRLPMTARQIEQKFGRANLSKQVERALKNNPEMEFVVAHMIEPNDDRIQVRDALNRPYRSMYWEEKAPEDQLLAVEGFEELPILTPRWMTVGQQVYGRGPGMQTLGDTKMTQKLHIESLLTVDKRNNPPLQAPGALKNENVNALPGGITYTDSSGGQQAVSPLYQVNQDIQPIEFKIEQAQRRIRTGFFNDVFLMLANQAGREMTAREVAERHEEKLLMLGPVLSRLYSELLNPLIDRTFAIAERNGLLPPPPPELEGQELQVEYISMLAQAQRMTEAFGVEELTAYVGGAAQLDPSVLDRVDFDKAIQHIADVKGVDPEIIRDDDQVEAIRAQRQQQAQMEQALAAAESASSSAKNLGSAPVGDGTALDVALGRPV